jgi:hypothetical protein
MLKQIKLLFKEKLMINNSEKEMYVNVILGTIIMTLKAIHEYYSENDIQYTKEMNKVKFKTTQKKGHCAKYCGLRQTKRHSFNFKWKSSLHEISQRNC